MGSVIELTVDVVVLVDAQAPHGVALLDVFVAAGVVVEIHSQAGVVAGLAAVARPRQLVDL